MREIEKITRGQDRDCATALRSRLFIVFGPAAFSEGSELIARATSSCVIKMFSSEYGGKFSVLGRDVRLSSS